MNPISNTAFYCCGVRMDDARMERPLCADHHAERFMDKRGLEIYAPFRAETMANISNVTRCRIIDDILRDRLRRDPDTQVITVGAGFDTRPYRMSGGRWLEVDEPAIIGYKEEKLPSAQCPNELRRLSMEFSSESLADRLPAPAGDRGVVVVIEGVLVYLEDTTIAATLRQVQAVLPRHDLVCDLMDKEFFVRYGHRVHKRIVAAGARFTDRPERPEAVIEGTGYAAKETVSIFRRAHELGLLKERAHIPTVMSRLMVDVFMKPLNGYTVRRFRYGPE